MFIKRVMVAPIVLGLLSFVPSVAVASTVGHEDNSEENFYSVPGVLEYSEPQVQEILEEEVAAPGVQGAAAVAVINAERSKHGLKPLKHLKVAQDTAQAYTVKWAPLYSSCSAGSAGFSGCHMDNVMGSSYRYSLARGQGWAQAGDLLGRGYTTEEAVAKAWLNSPGHRAWIMDSYAAMSGVGLGRVDNHWTLWVVGGALSNPKPNMTLVSGGTTVKPPVTATRISGDNRYDTNLAVNKKTMKTNKPVFIATGNSFPDALSIGPAVASSEGSLFLSSKNGLSNEQLSFIKSKKPSAFYVIGGPSVVPDKVVSQVREIASVKRIAGSNRYETSRMIQEEFFKNPATVFVATGANYPDALSAAAAGGRMNAPVILANNDNIPSLKGVKVIIVGGDSVVSSKVEKTLKSSGNTVSRASGNNRYETNKAVNKMLGSGKDNWVATGNNFPDALSAAAPAGNSNSLLVLSNGKCVTGASSNSTWTLVGGTGALPVSTAGLKAC